MCAEGIKGDSQIDRPPADCPDGWIDVLSFAWGVSNPVTIGGGATGSSAGKAAFSDFNTQLFGGRAVPEFVLRAATGRVIPKVKFVVLENAGDRSVVTYELEFTNAYVSAFFSSGSEGSRPTHSLSLAYEQIKLTVFIQNPDGTTSPGPSMSWNLTTMKKQ
jgi:type VI protein secretion system component Hcp